MIKRFLHSLVALTMLVSLLGMTACDSPDVATNKASEETAKTSSNDDELVFVEREIACNFDPNFYPGSIHFVKTKVGELLFKIQNDGSIKEELAKSIKQVSDNEWLIELRPEAKFWSGAFVTAKKVIGSLERSRETVALLGVKVPVVKLLAHRKNEFTTIRILGFGFILSRRSERILVRTFGGFGFFLNRITRTKKR